MSRYLNEGAVWSAVKRIPHITVQTRQAILEALRKVPTADVVEVIRCKDCKHYKKINYDDISQNTCEITTKRQQPYDFCSYGERMDGGVKE